MRPRSIAGAFRAEINDMRAERIAQAAATKAARHAECLARARAQDAARTAKAQPERNAHVAEPLQSILTEVQ